MKFERKHLKWAIPLAIIIPVSGICLVLKHHPELRAVSNATWKAATMRAEGEMVSAQDLKVPGLDTKLPAIYDALQSDFRLEVNHACDSQGNQIYQLKGNATRKWPTAPFFDFRQSQAKEGHTKYSNAFMGLLSESFNKDKAAEELDTPDFGAQVSAAERAQRFSINLCGQQLKPPSVTQNPESGTEQAPSLLKIAKPQFITDSARIVASGAPTALKEVAAEIGVEDSSLEELGKTLRVAESAVVYDVVGQPAGVRFIFDNSNEKAVAFFKQAQAKYLDTPHAGYISLSEFDMKNPRYKKHFLDRYEGIRPITYREDWIVGCHSNGVRGVLVTESESETKIDFMYQKARTNFIRFDRDTGARFDASCESGPQAGGGFFVD